MNEQSFSSSCSRPSSDDLAGSQEKALAAWHHHREVAEAHTAKCSCGRDCQVTAAFRMATRHEPVTFICYDAYCPDCGFSFRADNMQARMAA